MRFKFGKNRLGKTLNFKGILPDIIDDLDIKDSFLLESIKSIWPGIVGTIISEHSMPDRIFKKTLFISVDHSIYANELTMMKGTILDSIKMKLNISLIKNIKFEVKKIYWKKGIQ